MSVSKTNSDQISGLIDRMILTIVQEVQPEKIYLFGSQADGHVKPGSDVDFLIVEHQDFGPARSRWEEMKRVRKALKDYRIPKDILVYSLREFDKWRHSLNHIVSHAVQTGHLVYERP